MRDGASVVMKHRSMMVSVLIWTVACGGIPEDDTTPPGDNSGQSQNDGTSPGDGENGDDSSQDSQGSAAGGSCNTATDTPTCSGNSLRVCTDSVWVDENCEETGQVCSGHACVTPNDSCDRVDWADLDNDVYYDDVIMNEIWVNSWSLDAPFNPSLVYRLVLITLPTIALGTYTLSIPPQDDVTMVATGYLYPSWELDTVFAASEGTVQVQAASSAGFTFFASGVTVVEMNEVTGAPRESGTQLCLNDFDIATSAVTGFPCTFLDITPGQSACAEDATPSKQIAVCQAIDDETDELVAGDQCAADRVCQDSNPKGTAQCVSP